MNAGTLLPTVGMLVVFVAVFAVIIRVTGRTSDSLSSMFRTGAVRRQSGVQEDDDARWSWSRPPNPDEPVEPVAGEDPGRR